MAEALDLLRRLMTLLRSKHRVQIVQALPSWGNSEEQIRGEFESVGAAMDEATELLKRRVDAMEAPPMRLSTSAEVAKILRGWAKAYRDSLEHRFPSDPDAEFFPVDLENAADLLVLSRVEAGAKADATRELSVKALVSALEGSAANTDTDPRWVAASALRNLTNWEGRTIALSAPVPSPDGAALRSAPVSGPAKEPGWGQIVQLLLRAMDTSAKTENAAALAERMADGVQKLYGRVPAVGVTREAMRRELGISSDFDFRSWEDLERVFDKLLGSPVPDATVSEPVAWQWRACINGGHGDWLFIEETIERFKERNQFNIKNGTYEFRPLYTSPQHVDREATVSARDGVIRAILSLHLSDDVAKCILQEWNDQLPSIIRRYASEDMIDGIWQELEAARALDRGAGR